MRGALDEQMKKVRAEISVTPAAMKIHQPYLKGLLEHSVGVAELARSIAAICPEVNSD